MAGNVFEGVDPIQLTALARDLIAEEDKPVNTNSLMPWFPSLEVPSIKWEQSTGTTRTYTEAAPYRTFDVASPIGTRPGRGWMTGKLAPISIKYPLGEEEQLRILDLVSRGSSFADLVNGEILDDVGHGTRAILNRHQLFIRDLLVNGSVNLAERGVNLTYDPERNANREVTAGTVWSDSANATPFADERSVLNILRAYGLGWNDLYVITNQATWDEYSQIQEVIDTYQSNRVLPRLNDSQVTQVRREQSLPDVIVNDAMITPYNGSVEQLIPDGKWVYVPKSPVGRTQYAPTLAARTGIVPVNGTALPGVVSYVITQGVDPISLEIKVDGISTPVMSEPDATAVLTV